MRYIHFYGSSGYFGTDYHEFQTFDDDVEDEYISTISDEMAYDNADTYSYLYTGWYDDFESVEDEEQYYEDAMDYCGLVELSKEDWENLKEEYE